MGETTIRQHCWHQGGLILGIGYATQTDEICCWCGAVRTATIKQQAIPGHGPCHVPTTQLTTYQGGEQPCVAR
jgi:hypothetical protein